MVDKKKKEKKLDISYNEKVDRKVQSLTPGAFNHVEAKEMKRTQQKRLR